MVGWFWPISKVMKWRPKVFLLKKGKFDLTTPLRFYALTAVWTFAQTSFCSSFACVQSLFWLAIFTMARETRWQAWATRVNCSTTELNRLGNWFPLMPLAASRIELVDLRMMFWSSLNCSTRTVCKWYECAFSNRKPQLCTVSTALPQLHPTVCSACEGIPRRPRSCARGPPSSSSRPLAGPRKTGSRRLQETLWGKQMVEIRFHTSTPFTFTYGWV